MWGESECCLVLREGCVGAVEAPGGRAPQPDSGRPEGPQRYGGWRAGGRAPEPCCRNPEGKHQSLRLELGLEELVLDSALEAQPCLPSAPPHWNCLGHGQPPPSMLRALAAQLTRKWPSAPGAGHPLAGQWLMPRSDAGGTAQGAGIIGRARQAGCFQKPAITERLAERSWDSIREGQGQQPVCRAALTLRLTV